MPKFESIAGTKEEWTPHRIRYEFDLPADATHFEATVTSPIRLAHEIHEDVLAGEAEIAEAIAQGHSLLLRRAANAQQELVAGGWIWDEGLPGFVKPNGFDRATFEYMQPIDPDTRAPDWLGLWNRVKAY